MPANTATPSGAAPAGTSERECLSIVIPVKDRPELIVRCLDSIKAQTWRPLRIVVVDNASSDSTPQRVREWGELNSQPGLELELHREPAPGQASARRLGVEKVRTRLMMHFDSDDTMRPGHVESVMRVFSEHPETDLVAFRVIRHFPDGSSVLSHYATPGNLSERHLVHSILTSLGYVCTTELVRKAGSWNTALRRWEDWELGVRLAEAAVHPRLIPDVGVDVDCRAESVTGTDFSSRAGEWEEAIDAAETFLSRLPDQAKRRRLLPYTAYRRAILAAHYAREAGHATPLSGTLLREAVSATYLTSLQRLYLRLAYTYTRLGGRGASIPATLLFR